MEQLWKAFDGVIPLFLFTAVVAGVVYAVLHVRNPGQGRKPVFVNVLFSLSVMAILFITLYPEDLGPAGEQNVHLIPFRSMAEMIANADGPGVLLRNIGLNILLFVPFGFLFGARRTVRRRIILKATLAGLLLSLGVEAVQYFLGRTTDVDDVILNTFGALAGCVAWTVLGRMK
ncbi:VanZ family protein [Bhargavaea beijingensis]|uniref:Glycopeptide antibiotics resistance protein n=1 Tax=Bhargavaea beijingensis TaxID=426756 RepID=A0A1G6Y8H7_9BACL|nr:VanZ family protein [Bhargavaea beijingensis]MCW1927810.1 VanZ family protein [Bhargavaea beijingensis]SDD86571.1 Glycopeptide antibiotics resistance protein [Bhargavaea beijingensis]